MVLVRIARKSLTLHVVTLTHLITAHKPTRGMRQVLLSAVGEADLGSSLEVGQNPLRPRRDCGSVHVGIHHHQHLGIPAGTEELAVLGIECQSGGPSSERYARDFMVSLRESIAINSFLSSRFT